MTCAIISNGDEKLIPNKNEFEEPYITLKRTLREIIWKIYCNGYTDFYVNCEYGIPLWTSEIICALKYYNSINQHIIIPYEEQCSKWCEEWRNRYYSVHEQADSVVLASAHYFDNCYDNADKIMIDKSDTILVFGKQYDGLYATNYTKSKGKRIIYFNIVNLL